MGAIAEGIFAYAQPLIDQTDGSLEQVKQAMSLSQYCWNLSFVSEAVGVACRPEHSNLCRWTTMNSSNFAVQSSSP
jgi:hypothetical protein